MNSLPPDQRGAGAGMLNTFQNSATVLSMGLFFTIVTAGAGRAPAVAPVQGAGRGGRRPRRRRTWSPASRRSAACSRRSSATTRSRNCSARPARCSTCRASQVAYITGRSFFPKLIEEPFAGGLHLAFTFAAIATGIALVASAVRGKRYFHQAEPLSGGAGRGRGRVGRGAGPGRVVRGGRPRRRAGRGAAANGSRSGQRPARRVAAGSEARNWTVARNRLSP